MASNVLPSEAVSHINNNVDAIKFIEEKKALLERVANIVNAIQRLTSSLEVLLISSGSNPDLADKTFGLLDYLDEKQKHLSSGKIEIRLDALDNRIRDQLSQILSDINASAGVGLEKPSESEEQDNAEDPLEIVSEFRRKVQLSMAYRLLLIERGVDVNPINLDVAPELISSCIKKLEKEEDKFRTKLSKDIRDFQNDIKVLVNNQNLSTRMRSGFKEIYKQLTESLSFIKPKGTVATLPELFDMDVLREPEETNSDQVDDSIDEVKQPEPGKKGFMSTLNTWLSSPMDVSWKDAKNKD